MWTLFPSVLAIKPSSFTRSQGVNFLSDIPKNHISTLSTLQLDLLSNLASHLYCKLAMPNTRRSSSPPRDPWGGYLPTRRQSTPTVRRIRVSFRTNSLIHTSPKNLTVTVYCPCFFLCFPIYNFS